MRPLPFKLVPCLLDGYPCQTKGCKNLADKVDRRVYDDGRVEVGALRCARCFCITLFMGLYNVSRPKAEKMVAAWVKKRKKENPDAAK